MIELRLLGGLDLRHPDGTEIRSVLAQPKRVALLAYLAVHAAGSFQRRDTLLALFWPDSDNARARRSLRNAIYFVRQSLGEEALVARGDEEIGIDTHVLRCDAREFVEAAEAGAYARALELYRGDLLEGFFIADAPEFEHWLESERTALRNRAVQAAWALAEQEEASGNLALAAFVARRALEIAPDDEPAVRKLMALLDRSGDRPGALHVYENFARRLEREYAIEPAEETRTLAATLRSAPPELSPTSVSLATIPTAEVPEDEAQVVAAAGPHPGSPGLATPLEREEGRGNSPVGAGERQWVEGRVPPLHSWETGSGGEGRAEGEHEVAIRPRTPHSARRTVLRPLPVLLLLTVMALAAGAITWHLRTQTPPPTSPTVVAVLPFAFHGSGEFGYLGEGIVNLLSTSLDGMGELRSVDPRALLSVVAQRGAFDPQQGLTTAERFGAGLYVLGHIVEVGVRLQITAALYERRGGRGTLVSEATVSGPGEQLFTLIDELSTKLVASRIRAPGERLSRLAALTTHSLPALKAFLEGEAQLRTGRYDAAVEAFEQAVAADTSFALAHYRLSSAATWINQHARAEEAAQQALRFGERLSRRDRLLVEAWDGYLRGAGDRAGALYRTVLTSHPDDVEAWFQLGEVMFHWEPMLGRPPTEAREAFERVLSYEPNNVSALIHLARLAAREGEHERLDSLIERILILEPEGDQALEMSALRAYTSGDTAAQGRTAELLDRIDGGRFLGIVQTVAAHSYNLAGAAELARQLTEGDRDPMLRARGLVVLAQLELARGRWSAALRELQALERLRPGWGVLLHAGFTLAPFHPASPAELETLRAALARAEPSPWNPNAAPTPDGAPQRAYQPRQSYLLGVLSARLGDPVAALQHAVELDRSAGPPLEAAYGRDLGPYIRAHVAWQGGHPADALAALGEPHLTADSMLPFLFSFPKADERWLRAELLRTLGRDEGALRWYSTFPDPQGYDLIYLAPSHLRRAEIHERRGEVAEALVHYRRFVGLWKDCDAELRPWVEAAQARVANLSRR